MTAGDGFKPQMPHSRHGASALGTAGGFQSILFDRPTAANGLDQASEPDFFGDLNLDHVMRSITDERQEYALQPFFWQPLHNARSVRYRHQIFRDLEDPDVHASITRFANTTRRMRQYQQQIEKVHDALQQQAWFLEATEAYCGAVATLADELSVLHVDSDGFQALRDYLAEYTATQGFRSLLSQTQALRQDIALIRYTVLIHGARVTVSKSENEPDYGREVEKTFAKFQQAGVRSYLTKLLDYPEMDHVEQQILSCVARLYPDVFESLAKYCDRWQDYLVPTVARFDREVQFYLAYLTLIDRLRTAGLPFCYPLVREQSNAIAVEETFDIALADMLVREGSQVVCNDFHLREPERVFVVTGPNNGGKTTFARMVGQVHYLASLGLPVPGRSAQLFLPDRIYTHFEREEDVATLRGKFEDELVRVRAILDRATENSLIIMNESFGSTTLNDALAVGTAVMRQILQLGCPAVYVTFVDEITSMSDATVSMVSQIQPENPAERTFKILRQPADGLAYASAIATKYGLTHDRLLDRID